MGLLLLTLTLMICGVWHSEASYNMIECPVEDHANLEACLLKLITELGHRFRTGIPEMNIPVMDPMIIPYIDFVESVPLIEINARVSQVFVRGVSSFESVKVHTEPKKEMIHITLEVPELVVNGFYDVTGNVMSLRVRGDGTFWIVLNGIKTHVTVVYKIVKNRLRAVSTEIQFNVRGMRLRFNNLFGGNTLAGDIFNGILNDNSQLLLEKLKPLISSRISEAFSKILNDAFSTLPSDNTLEFN